MKSIALLFVLFGFYQLISTQTCSFQENGFYSYDEVLQCFKSIPLDYQVKTQTLETMKRSLELYAFYDIAHDSPDPNLPLKVNMQKGLQEIYDRPYLFDIDFQEDLRYLYIQLDDAHTQYYLPACYQNILIRQGLAPIGSGSTLDNFNITISPYIPDDLLEYYGTLNIDLTQYIGAKLLYVNGIPSYDYFLTYANHSVGISKEFGTRFNYALTIVEPRDDISIIQYGYWQQRTHRNPFPDTPTIIYTLDVQGAIVNLTLPWSFQALKTYTGVDSFMDDYWAVYSNPSSSPDERDQKLRQHFETLSVKSKDWKENPYSPSVTHSFMSLAPSVKPHITQYKEKLLEEYKRSHPQYAEYSFELLANSSHLTFWALSDNKTLVMYLDTMEPGRFSDYYPTLIKGFSIAAQRGLSRFIIDLTNNGGGSICLGQSLLSFLQQSGWNGQGQNWGPQDLPLSTLAEQLVNSAVEFNVSSTVWSPAFYDNQKDQHIENNDTSYILPGVPHERGGLLRNYSRLLHINDCGEFGYYIEPKVNFPPEQVMIVTKGFCGSTCALFANHMALYDNIQTVVVGGIPGSDQMQYTSFPGLQVLDDGPLFGQFLELRQNITACPVDENKDDPVPRLLLTQATFRYCIREIYPPVPNYDQSPMEYTFQPATHHIFFTELTANYPQYIWYEVLDYFPASL